MIERKVLLMDDDRDMLRLLGRQLTKAGAAAFLRKPVDPDAVVAELESMV